MSTLRVQVDVEAIYGEPNLSALVSVFESNLDLDQVAVRRTEHAVKAITPLEFLIVATSTYIFEKLILAPLIDPIAEKFNWANAVKKYLKPIQPFNLVVRIEQEGLVIEAPLGTNHNITAEIWDIVKKTLDILRGESRLDVISKIRFTPRGSDELLILCYEANRPRYLVDLSRREIRTMPEDQIPQYGTNNRSVQDFVQEQIERAREYRRFVSERRQLE